MQTCPDGSVIPVTQPCPPPPPPPPVLSTVFAGVTTDTGFATLGLEAEHEGSEARFLIRDGFAVSYDADSNAYIVQLPSTSSPSAVRVYNEDASYWRGYLESQDPFFDVFKPSSTNPDIALAYTSFGISSGYYSQAFGFTAFGIATPGSGIPLSGTASYDAHVAGRVLNGPGFITGDATLQFDFGTGTLAGHFDPVLMLNNVNTNLGRYDFVNTVFGAGSTTFSGSLSHPGTSDLGAFDGRFTGPAAEELMSRWSAPYLHPVSQTWAEMFGVWVGRRQ